MISRSMHVAQFVVKGNCKTNPLFLANEKSREFHPTFQIGSDTLHANEFFIESSLKIGASQRF